MSAKLVIFFEDTKYKFKYSFNDNTTFEDVLESFSFNYPDLKICPCYKIQKFDRFISYKDVDMKGKIKDYLSLILNDQFRIVFKNDNNRCNCDSILKEYYRRPKIEIINKLKEYKSKVESYENELKRKETLNKEITFTDFYDIIINMNSIKDVSKGCEIKMSQNAKENYEKFKESKPIKLGVIGNANKGKSFLLSKISKYNLPSGTSIRTEGLSVKYLEFDKSNSEFENRKIALLDSAGLETPVLKEDQSKEGKKKSDIKEENKKKNEFFKEKSREKIITELFLQNYIINYSDILLIVVGNLTYSEQKLIHKIKTEFMKLREKKKINKPLYVIHNLMTYKTIAQVREYIQDNLLKSATFDLEEREIISTEKKGKDYTKNHTKNYTFFSEINVNLNIIHLIFAHEGSEAGNFYNKKTLKFIESLYKQVNTLESFDVIETVKDKFVEISKDIFEKSDNPIKKESFDNSSKEFIKLSKDNELTLKKCLIDELGFSNLKANGFEPTYNYYKSENGKKFIIKVEAPGNCGLSIEKENDYIKIKGTKFKDTMTEKEENNQYSCREYGEFSFDVPQEELLLDYKEPEIKHDDGIFTLEYGIKEKEKPIIINPERKN